MPADGVDSFLNLIKRRLNNDESHHDVEVEYDKFRRGSAPYGTFL